MSQRKEKPSPCYCEACQNHYSITTLAKRWDVSPKTIRRWIKDGKLHSKRIGGSVRIPHSEAVKIVSEI